MSTTPDPALDTHRFALDTHRFALDTHRFAPRHISLTDAERANAVARTIRCPQCRIESVAESNVGIAREIRADIARRIDAGETDDQIADRIAAAVGTKWAGHQINRVNFVRPARTMSQIGG